MILFLPVIITKHGTQTEWKKRKGEEEEGRVEKERRRRWTNGEGKKGRRRVAGKERRGEKSTVHLLKINSYLLY